MQTQAKEADTEDRDHEMDEEMADVLMAISVVSKRLARKLTMLARQGKQKEEAPMKLVFICSPYRGDVEANTARTKRYCYFAHTQGVAPVAPHLHNPQFLDENFPDERQAGIAIGIEYLRRADELWCFGDRLTEGMVLELQAAQQLKIPIRYFTDRCEEVQ